MKLFKALLIVGLLTGLANASEFHPAPAGLRDLPTAEQARNEAREVRHASDGYALRFEQVKETIEAAVKDGDASVKIDVHDWNGSVLSDIEDALGTNGYTVWFNADAQDGIMNVSWGI